MKSNPDRISRVTSPIGQNGGRRRNRRGDNIDEAVAVPIEKSERAPEQLSVEIIADLIPPDFGEPAAAIVVEELRRHVALDSRSVEISHVAIGDHQIEIAVVVGIKELSPPFHI